MSASYYLACRDCKSYVWVGQSQNSAPAFCFYSGEPHTMEALRDFLWWHMGHALVVEDSQILVQEGVLLEDEHGYILGEVRTVKTCPAPELPPHFMGVDHAVAGSDRTVYYQRIADGTYTELEGIPNG